MTVVPTPTGTPSQAGCPAYGRTGGWLGPLGGCEPGIGAATAGGCGGCGDAPHRRPAPYRTPVGSIALPRSLDPSQEAAALTGAAGPPAEKFRSVCHRRTGATPDPHNGNGASAASGLAVFARQGRVPTAHVGGVSGQLSDGACALAATIPQSRDIRHSSYTRSRHLAPLLLVGLELRKSIPSRIPGFQWLVHTHHHQLAEFLEDQRHKQQHPLA